MVQGNLEDWRFETEVGQYRQKQVPIKHLSRWFVKIHDHYFHEDAQLLTMPLLATTLEQSLGPSGFHPLAEYQRWEIALQLLCAVDCERVHSRRTVLLTATFQSSIPTLSYTPTYDPRTSCLSTIQPAHSLAASKSRCH